MAPHANRRYDAEVKAFVAYLSSVLGMLLAMVLAAPPAKAFHAMPQTKPAVPTAPLRFEHLSLEDGLSQNAVLSMLQDRQGFLWFGTQDGLNRYDGYNFTVFKTDPENPSSISLASILDIEEDPDGLLWLGTWGGGLNRFDPATGKAVRFQNDPSAADSLGNDVVASVFGDSQGRLWIGTMGGGLNRLDRQTGRFVRYVHDSADPNSIASDYVSTIVEGSDGALWIGTGGFATEGSGLDRFDPQTGLFSHFRHGEDDPTSLSSDTISSILVNPDGTLWVGTGGFSLTGSGMNLFNPQTGRAVRFQNDPTDPDSLSSDSVMSITRDRSGTIWVGTWAGGLEQLDESDGRVRFVHSRYDPFDADSISADIVWPVLEDRSGVLWVGTINGGINRVNPKVQRFRLYRNNPSDSTSLGFDVIGGFYEDSKGRLWVGTWGGGVDVFDPATSAFQHYRHNPDDPTSLSDDTVSTFYEDPSGDIWIGTFNGLNRLDRETGRFTHYRHDPNERNTLINDSILAILPEGEDKMWLATLDGLDLFDPQTGRFTHFQHREDDPESLPGNEIVELYRDPAGTLWVGTWHNGMASLDPEAWQSGVARFTSIQHDPDNPQSLSHDGAYTIHRDRTGALWVGTQVGLNRLDEKTGKVKRYFEKDGLPNNSPVCILEDDDGFLWISTNNGLTRFDPREEQFRNFDVRDGLQSNEFDSGACLRTRDGTLVFGGIHGFNAFRPKEIQDNPIPPPVAITGFSVLNRPVSVDLTGQVPIELSYDEDFVGFDFAALDYYAPQKNRYAYKLEGLDPNWVDAGTRRYASYTSLPAGRYVFRVKGSNSDGVWNESGASLAITVKPPFWDTWPFRGLLLFGFGAVLAGGMGWRLRTIRAQKRDLERQVAAATAELRLEIVQRQQAEQALAQKAAEEAVAAERTRLARDLHDAVTQTLFSSSLIADVLPQLWQTNPPEALRSTEELRQMTRGALAEMRALLLELRPSAVESARLDELLRQLSEAVIGRGRLPVTLSVQGQRPLPSDIKLTFYRIAQEALNNVVKYAKARQVTLDLRMQPTGVRMVVGDDGIGFDPEAVGPTHLGVRIMRERAEAVDARVSIISEVGHGTMVIVTWSDPESETV